MQTLVAQASNDLISAESAHGVVYAENFAGADAGAQIQAAHDAMPAGTILDARGLSGGSAAATIALTKKCKLRLPAALTLAGNPGILADADRVVIEGCGEQLSIINYNQAGTAIQFRKTDSSELVQCRLRGVAFGSTDSTNTKIAVEIVDASDFILEDVATYPWLGNGSIGVRLRGREAIRLKNIFLSANKPLVISDNPNSSIDIDHLNVNNAYFIADGFPNVTIDDGVNLSTVVFDGQQAWVKGTYGLYWNDTTSAMISQQLSIKNVRWEQEQDPNGWLIYINHNYALDGLVLENISGGLSARGFFLRKVKRSSWNTVYYVSSTGIGLDLNSTDTFFSFRNVFFQTGSTKNLTGFDNDVFAEDSSDSEAGQRFKFGTLKGGEFVTFGNEKFLGWRNAADSAVVRVLGLNAANQVRIAPNGNGTFIGGTLQLGASPGPQTHQVSIPNGTWYGAQNAANSDSVGLIALNPSGQTVISASAQGTFILGALQLGASPGPQSHRMSIPFGESYAGQNAANTDSVAIAAITTGNKIVISPGGAETIVNGLLTANENILPDTTGNDLGWPGARWDAFLQVAKIYSSLNLDYATASKPLFADAGKDVVAQNIDIGAGYSVASSLTASKPIFTDASKNVISQNIDIGASYVTGDVPISRGGTGATTAAGARTALSLYSIAEVDTALDDKATAGAYVSVSGDHSHSFSGTVTGAT